MRDSCLFSSVQPPCSSLRRPWQQQALVIRPLAERKVWLFTLGSAGGLSPGGTKVLVSSSSASELQSLVRFVVDATQPFSSPASLP